jgi:hypothetical protein
MNPDFIERQVQYATTNTMNTLANNIGGTDLFNKKIKFKDLLNSVQNSGGSEPADTTNHKCGLFVPHESDPGYVIFRNKSYFDSNPYTSYDVSSTILKDFYNYYSIMKSNYKDTLENYKESIVMLKSIDSIVINKRNNLARIKKKIKIYNQNYLIDDRKNYYSEENKVFFSYLYYFIIFLYIISFILILIIINFFKNKLYKNIKVVLLLLLYIIIPFIIRFILDYSYKLYINFLEENNMRDEIVSYKDIVEDSDSIKANKRLFIDDKFT